MCVVSKIRHTFVLGSFFAGIAFYKRCFFEPGKFQNSLIFIVKLNESKINTIFLDRTQHKY